MDEVIGPVSLLIASQDSEAPDPFAKVRLGLIAASTEKVGILSSWQRRKAFYPPGALRKYQALRLARRACA